MEKTEIKAAYENITVRKGITNVFIAPPAEEWGSL